MGDTDGSSMAAQSAQPTNGGDAGKEKAGIFSRIVDAFSPQSEDEVQVTNGQDVDKVQPRGMINLRRMRVEDVAIPTAEIIYKHINLFGPVTGYMNDLEHHIPHLQAIAMRDAARVIFNLGQLRQHQFRTGRFSQPTGT